MENTVNIMAMVQKTGIVNKKSDVPSKPLWNDITNFRKELHQARKEINKHNNIDIKDVGEMNQNTTEKKLEKLAKVMSNNNTKAEVKTEVKEKPSVEALGQTDAAETKPNSEIADTKQLELIEEEVKVEESVQTILDTVQQLIQMMQGLNIESASNVKLTELKTELQTVIQKLEQLLETPLTSQAVELNALVNSMKNNLTELVSKLEIVPEHELDSKQSEQLINQLADKLTQTKNLNNQILQVVEESQKNSEVPQLPLALVVKVENKEVNINSDVKVVEAIDETQQIQKADNDMASSTKDNEEDETSHKANESNNAKQAVSGEKLNLDEVNEIVAPQVEKENFQLNLKQANTNLQKESLVKFNASDIINQVIKKAEVFVQGSHQEMVMKLEPESLGKINLKVIVENGIVTAKFLAESQQVKAVLESSFNQLKDALQEKGITVQSFSVSVGQQGAEFNSGKGFDQWKQTIKLSSKISGQYLGLDEENSMSTNPYSYHEGKVDYRA